MKKEIEAMIEAAPGNIALYERALTHGSASEDDYQRLEFLGDRVLGLVIAETLYRDDAREAEGNMAHRLNARVNGPTCADVARRIGLPPLVRLGKQARDDGARDSDKVLGDIMEAVIGALYIDKGFDSARSFITRLWAPLLEGQAEAPKHPKSQLQEWAAKARKGTPHYELTAQSGPSHNRRFEVTLSLKGMDPVTATGSTKQEAETRAAALFLERTS